MAEALEVRLLATDEERIGKIPTDDLQAYDFYLVGRHHLNIKTDESLRRALEYFGRSMEVDPAFALPVAGLSEALLFSGVGYSLDPPQDAVAKAMAAAKRAIELDDTLPEAYVSLVFASIHTLDFSTAEEGVTKALALNPGHAQVHRAHAWTLFCKGRFEEATVALDRALALDPKSFAIMTESGWPYGYQGKHEIALERYRAALEMAPDFALARFNVAWALQRMGKLDEAVQSYEEAVSMSGGSPFMRAWLAAAYVEQGREDQAREMLGELQQARDEGDPLGVMIALVHDSLGEKKLALDALEEAYEAREPAIAWVGITPEFAGFVTLQDEPRFQELCRRIRGP